MGIRSNGSFSQKHLTEKHLFACFLSLIKQADWSRMSSHSNQNVGAGWESSGSFTAGDDGAEESSRTIYKSCSGQDLYFPRVSGGELKRGTSSWAEAGNQPDGHFSR
jgi:hypothetical protein